MSKGTNVGMYVVLVTDLGAATILEQRLLGREWKEVSWTCRLRPDCEDCDSFQNPVDSVRSGTVACVE